MIVLNRRVRIKEIPRYQEMSPRQLDLHSGMNRIYFGKRLSTVQLLYLSQQKTYTFLTKKNFDITDAHLTIFCRREFKFFRSGNPIFMVWIYRTVFFRQILKIWKLHHWIHYWVSDSQSNFKIELPSCALGFLDKV